MCSVPQWWQPLSEIGLIEYSMNAAMSSTIFW
jgi:hypothetical protein